MMHSGSALVAGLFRLHRMPPPALLRRLLSVEGSSDGASGSEGTSEGDRESAGKGKTLNLSVSSLRVDAVAAAGLALSRQYGTTNSVLASLASQPYFPRAHAR